MLCGMCNSQVAELFTTRVFLKGFFIRWQSGDSDLGFSSAVYSGSPALNEVLNHGNHIFV